VIRFDGNTSPSVPPFVRAEALAGALAEINTYPHGGYPGLDAAIARYAGVAPENVVLGAGADDVILLVTRSFAGPGDRVAIANDPTYGLFANAVGAAGADVGDDDPALTICCRPNNPTGELGDLPDARPLMVDEAYFEYSGVTAADLIDNDDVIVVRTFSKAFGLAGARVGYALAGKEIAAELNRRQGPAPVSTLSVALVLAGLESPSDVRPILEERERFASALRAQGLEPLPSAGNFLAVPLPEPFDVANRLSLSGLPVRPYRDGIRITVRGRQDDDVLLAALTEL
jgi:histidinol-phosphate aminotransferase